MLHCAQRQGHCRGTGRVSGTQRALMMKAFLPSNSDDGCRPSEVEQRISRADMCTSKTGPTPKSPHGVRFTLSSWYTEDIPHARRTTSNSVSNAVIAREYLGISRIKPISTSSREVRSDNDFSNAPAMCNDPPDPQRKPSHTGISRLILSLRTGKYHPLSEGIPCSARRSAVMAVLLTIQGVGDMVFTPDDHRIPVTLGSLDVSKSLGVIKVMAAYLRTSISQADCMLRR